MAIYHLNAKLIGRSKGRSAVGAAAYRSGSIITNEYDGITHDYSRKKGILYSEVILCDNAPVIYKDRSQLWNAVELTEKDSKAQLSRELEIALPNELNLERQILLVQKYINKNLTSEGMCADFSIHDKGDGNPHVHIMLTVRPIDEHGKFESKREKVYLCKNADGEERGFTARELANMESSIWQKQLPYYKNGNPKSRPVYLTKREYESDTRYMEYQRIKGKNNPKKSKDDRVNPMIEKWNSVDTLRKWRSAWANICNQELEQNGFNERIDHRSYIAQGRTDIPSIHIGVAALQMERRGIKSDRGNIHRDIKQRNAELRLITNKLLELHRLRNSDGNIIRSDIKNVKAVPEGLKRWKQTKAQNESFKEYVQRKTGIEQKSKDEMLSKSSRQDKLTRVEELSELYGYMEQEKIFSLPDCDSRERQLLGEKRELMAQEKELQEKVKQYGIVLDYLITYNTYLPIHEEGKRVSLFNRRKFEKEHAKELESFKEAGIRLKEAGINTDIKPDKLEGLIKDKGKEIEIIQGKAKCVDMHISKVRSLKRLIAKHKVGPGHTKSNLEH